MKTRLALLALCGCLVFAGCGKKSEENAGGGGGPVSEHYARLLPAKTIVYARLQGVGDLKDRLVKSLPAHISNSQDFQKQINTYYDNELFKQLAKDNPFGLGEASLKKLVSNTQAVHVAVLPHEESGAGGSVEPQPVVFLQMGSGSVINDAVKEMGANLQQKDLQGTKVHAFTNKEMQGFSLYILEERVAVIGPDALVSQVIAAKGGSKPGMLGDVPAFQKAYSELAKEGDLFVYFNPVELRAELVRQVDSLGFLPPDEKERRRKEIQNFPFQDVGTIAGAASVEGNLTVRAYAVAGKQFPEFLVRTPSKRKFLARMPADSVLAYAVGYEGGKKTRQSFAKWLEEETKKEGGGSALFPKEMTEAFTKNLDKLEQEVVIVDIAKDFWAAVIPVKSEMGLCVAQDPAGRWGAAVFFDYEDKAQAEKLKQEIFLAGKRADLPWEETLVEGLPFRYLDVEKLARDKGEILPKELLDNVQLKVGYVMTNELFVAGTLETVKFVLKPQGKTLADVVSYKGIDESNAVFLNVQAGKFFHSSTKIPAWEGMEMVAQYIPKDSSYSLTVNIEKDRATLRTNFPVWAPVGAAMLFLVKGSSADVPTSRPVPVPREPLRPAPPLPKQPVPPESKDRVK